jgi:hypothetical protein
LPRITRITRIELQKQPQLPAANYANDAKWISAIAKTLPLRRFCFFKSKTLSAFYVARRRAAYSEQIRVIREIRGPQLQLPYPRDPRNPRPAVAVAVSA